MQGGSLQRLRKRVKLSADYYNRLRKELASQGRIRVERAGTTKINMSGVWKLPHLCICVREPLPHTMLKKPLHVLNWVKIRAVKLKRRLATIWLGILVTVPPKNSVKIINFLRHISLKIFHYRPKVLANIAA